MTTQTRLHRLWRRVRTEPHLGRSVTAVAVLLVLAAVAGAIILGRQGSGLTTWPWTDRFTFRAVFDDAHGVAPGQGQEVRIAGVPVGAIEDAAIDEDGNAVLELGIERGHRIYRNAVLVLRPKSPLNEMYVEVNPGGPPAKPIAEDGKLPMGNTRSPVTIDRVTQHLDDDVRQALGALITESDVALARAPGKLPGGLRAADTLMRDLKPVAESLQTRQERIARLVSALATVSQAVGGNDERLAQIADSLHSTLGATGRSGRALDTSLGRLPQLSRKLRGATEAVGELTIELDPALDDIKAATGELPKALSGLAGTAKRVRSVAEKAGPVLDVARPVLRDLRPVIGDLTTSLRHLKGISARLPGVTRTLVPYLHRGDLQAFIHNTADATKLADADGGMLRGIAQFGPDSLPLLSTLGSGK